VPGRCRLGVATGSIEERNIMRRFGVTAEEARRLVGAKVLDFDETGRIKLQLVDGEVLEGRLASQADYDMLVFAGIPVLEIEDEEQS
jgi:hypothetical protein